LNGDIAKKWTRCQIINEITITDTWLGTHNNKLGRPKAYFIIFEAINLCRFSIFKAWRDSCHDGIAIPKLCSAAKGCNIVTGNGS